MDGMNLLRVGALSDPGYVTQVPVPVPATVAPTTMVPGMTPVVPTMPPRAVLGEWSSHQFDCRIVVFVSRVVCSCSSGLTAIKLTHKNDVSFAFQPHST